MVRIGSDRIEELDVFRAFLSAHCILQVQPPGNESAALSEPSFVPCMQLCILTIPIVGFGLLGRLLRLISINTFRLKIASLQ